MEPPQIKEITHSSLGRKLLAPIQVSIPKTKDLATKDVYDFIITSLDSSMPSLIPFAFQNQSVLNMVKNLKRYRSGSPQSAAMYMWIVHRYCRWSGKQPDEIIGECKNKDGDPDQKMLTKHTNLLDNFIGTLQASRLSSRTILTQVSAIKTFYRTNKLEIHLPEMPQVRVTYHDRAPTPEELSNLLKVADLRENVIISCLALGGFRVGTLSRLQYGHIKPDFERGIVPIHVYVEAGITKGKYHGYDTFLGQEAFEYIRAYLEVRKRGSPCGKMPAENIGDNSPLIRSKQDREAKPLTPAHISDIVRDVYIKGGLIKRNPRLRRYRVRPHSIRKFFRTQLAALGVERDYIEYMMGHTISTYHDIEMKGVEFLRNVYAASGLSIRPKTQLSKISALKEIIRAWGMNPEEILTKKALSTPHRIYAGALDRDEDTVSELRKALKEMMRKELLDEKQF
ncbi:MAG: site-specific integrase [Candidatus Bathyarchaeota archaeon]|nr:site-specific integrase [Candidatus Bathyarchaeota archaeon]